MEAERPQAVAIRYDKVTAGPKDIIGTNPIMIFTEQGMCLAKNSFSKETGNATPLGIHKIDNIIFILDRSGSMGETARQGMRQNKMEYIKGFLKKMNSDLLPESNLCILDFDDVANLVEFLCSKDPKAISEFKNHLDSIYPRSGTNFKAALSKAIQLLSGRTLVIFITDGECNSDTQDAALQLAEEMREKNAGTFIIGVGADYNLNNILDFSGRFGYSGWAHTPMPADRGDVLELLIKPFVAEMQACDYYLKVKAEGEVQRFMGLSPSLRPVYEGNLCLGYQQEGLGILFEDKNEPKLTLEIAEDVMGNGLSRHDIPIIDKRDAFAHFEKVQAGDKALAAALLFMTQKECDLTELKKLGTKHPHLQRDIQTFIDNADRTMNDNLSRSITLEGMSAAASLTRFSLLDSDELGNADNDQENDDSHKTWLHSGELGPLSEDPPSLILPLYKDPDADAYNRHNPDTEFAAFLHDIHGIIDLNNLWENNEIIIGREEACAIVINEMSVSRRHCKLTLDLQGKRIYIEDLSKNGTLLNGEIVSTKTILQHGDQILIGGRFLLFNFNKI